MSAYVEGQTVLTVGGHKAEVVGHGVKLRFADGSASYFDESHIADTEAVTADATS